LFIAHLLYVVTRDILNTAILSRITEKEILVAKDTIDCIPYVKKKVLKYCSARDAFVHKMSRPRRVRAYSLSRGTLTSTTPHTQHACTRFRRMGGNK